MHNTLSRLRSIIFWGHLGLLAVLFAVHLLFQWPDRPVFSMLAIFLLLFTGLEWLMLTVMIMRQKKQHHDKVAT
ncbi:MAG: hypothetical protein EBZ69_05460 [Alphaproteobacteria bacterium]|nr:hypothetical protein [Alphaproteobacteria bacterium]NDC56240.1 hypothetical protein [Alphaproteobacteria bacterium]